MCPATGRAHTEASSGGRYDLNVSSNTTDALGYERGWGVCSGCRAVACFGSPAAGNGLCPARPTGPVRTHQPMPNLTLALPMEHSSSPEFMAHELGHTLGLQHMHSTRLTRDNGNDNAAGAYGDNGDVMGTGSRPAVQFGSAAMPYAAAGALVQGWIPEDKVVRRSWSPGQTVEVALSDPESSGTAPHLLVLRAPNATYGIELEEAPTTRSHPQAELLQVRRTHLNFAAGRASFMNCTRCGGLFDVHDRVCAAGGAHYTPDSRGHEEAPAGEKPKRYVATRNRWTLPCFCFVVCTRCGRLHPEHTDPNTKGACLGVSGHADRYAKQSYFFGWSAFRTEAQLEPWSDCTRCGLLVRMSATRSRCAAGGEHTLSGRRFDPTERRLEWGMVRLATEMNLGRGVERGAKGDWDALTVELTRSGGVNTVKVR